MGLFERDKDFLGNPNPSNEPVWSGGFCSGKFNLTEENWVFIYIISRLSVIGGGLFDPYDPHRIKNRSPKELEEKHDV